jgi:histidinol dehydrogenase
VTAATGLRLARLELAAATTDAAVAAHVRRLVRRGAVPDARVRESARAIIEDVRRNPSLEVRKANARYGGGLHDGRLVIERREMAAPRDALDARIRDAVERAIANVRTFAETQLPASTRTTIAPGIEIERRWRPVATVGCYVPGGTAPYPSSLVMTVVPARVAGVGTVVVASPASAEGVVNPILLGVAGLLDVDALVVAGGAQAIAALAFGLSDDGIAPVDRIVGPGNSWVTAAKLALAAEVGIDLPAGPSEGMVLAAPPADPARVAADLLTQAEHGVDSPAILVTTDRAFAAAVEVEVAGQLETAPRRSILERALAEHGAIVIAPDLAAAIRFVNAYAPEHLSVDVVPVEPVVEQIRNAGSVFVGPWAPEAAGDYATGANHVLPTGGLARSSGPLGVETFGKFVQVQRVTKDGLASIRSAIRALAEAEGLLAHRDAVEIRFRDGDEAAQAGAAADARVSATPARAGVAAARADAAPAPAVRRT